MVPEKRNSHLAGALERDKARKLLGLKSSGRLKKVETRGSRRRKLRVAKERVASISPQLLEHVAREGKIPRGRESLMLTSAPADLLTPRRVEAETEEVIMGKASGPLRKGESVLVRIKSRAGYAAQQVAKVVETTGEHRVTLIQSDGTRLVARLGDVRRNAPGTKFEDDGTAEPAKEEEGSMLSAKVGEQIVSKIKTPSNFESAGKTAQPELFSALLKRTRLEMGFPFPLLARVLDVTPILLKQLEEQEAVPDADLVQRFAEMCRLNPDEVMAAAARTETEAAAKLQAEQELKAKTERDRAAASAKKRQEFIPLVAQPRLAVVTAGGTPPRGQSFEQFSERVMEELCALPRDKSRRAQWFVATRILFQLVDDGEG